MKLYRLYFLSNDPTGDHEEDSGSHEDFETLSKREDLEYHKARVPP